MVSLSDLFQHFFWLGRSKIRLDREKKKLDAELSYWYGQKAFNEDSEAKWYEHYFTEYFGLHKRFYSGKNILDIGCGPKGSLDWCKNAERVLGLDPLAEHYMKMSDSFMNYVKGTAERMPFEDNSFDVVTSFNSLDHVDDVDKSISEIKRVTAENGMFLLITEVNHDERVTEPQTISQDIIEKFRPEFKIVSSEIRAMNPDKGVHGSARTGRRLDEDTNENAVLSAKLTRL